MAENLYESKYLKWLVTLAICAMVWQAAWSLAWEAGTLIRTIYSITMVSIFLYLATQLFIFSVLVFGFLSMVTYFGNAVFKVSEHYGTQFGVIFLCLALFIMGGTWIWLDKMRLRCKKCGNILEDADLLDEETVTIYKCPKCGTITNYTFKGKYGKLPPSKHEDDDFYRGY